MSTRQTASNRLYLVRCFRQNKFLFLLALLFIGVVFYGHKTGCEITPALVFSMYTSHQHVEKDSFLKVAIDGRDISLFHTIDEPRRMMIFSTLSAYRQGMLAGGRDPQEAVLTNAVQKHPFISFLAKRAFCMPEDYQQYLPWLLRYIQNAVDPTVSRIDISGVYIHYDIQNLPVADSTRHLYEFEATSTK
jgi:hypothetical protein